MVADLVLPRGEKSGGADAAHVEPGFLQGGGGGHAGQSNERERGKSS